MKRVFSILCIALAALICVSVANAQDLSDYKKIDYKVRDLALIYQGGTHRIGWTQTEIEPYVTHKFEDGREEWIFDGYLFLEFTTGGYNGHQFTEGYNGNNATKEDWEWYLGRLFQGGRALDALDRVIEKKKELIGDPGFKHQVSLTLFVPINGQTDWGEIDGKTLKFTRMNDRVVAGKWFIDELVRRFNEAAYKNLELYGIYMICESSYGIEGYTQRMKSYIADYGLEFIWIPYFNARGYDRWAELGFDHAYLQPNHFFNEETPDNRLREAIALAKAKGLSMEFECDERALSQVNPSFLYRMEAYMDYFDKYGIWYDTPVAYYTGNHMFLDMVRKPSAKNNAAMDRLCQYIVNRRLKALENSGVDNVVVEDTAPEYYNLQGLRVENPVNGIFIEKKGSVTRKVFKQ